MFGRMVNNYYYGKSGKGDFRKDDMPETRMQLFWDTLRTRLSGLCRLSLMYSVIWIPFIIVVLLNVTNLWSSLNEQVIISEKNYAQFMEWAQEQKQEITISEEEYNNRRSLYLVLNDNNYNEYLERINGSGEEPLTQEQFDYVRSNYGTDLQNKVFWFLVMLIPCIAITGPATAGISYVTRNWARDEHAFIWTDFKDAVKENWKIPLLLSTITALLPVLVYQAWITYGRMAATNMIMIVPRMLVLVVGILWAISLTYMHPLTITYDLKVKDVFRNGFLLGIARLPFSVGIRLLHCVPTAVAFMAVWFFGLDLLLALVVLFAYYALIGYGLSRFVTASYTNAVFDRYINSRIEGAKVNQGLREKDEFDEYEDEEDEKQEETEE